MNLFVTGTDTDAGKTYVTALILRGLRERGIDAVGFKPVSCGENSDAALLAEASGGIDPAEVCPLAYRSPLAPHVAAMLEGQPADPAHLAAAYHALAAKHECVVVEGVGGWEVPLAERYRVSDFAQTLGLPVLLVVGNKLGALNHALLTADAIRARGLRCIGIVLNQLGDELDTAMVTNRGVISALSGLPLLDHVIHGQDFISDEVLDAVVG